MKEQVSIVMPLMATDDDMVEIRLGDLRRLADGFICQYFGIEGDFSLAQIRWALNFATAINMEAEGV